MSHHTAQTVLNGLSGQPAFLDARYADGADGMTSVAAHIRQLAVALPEAEENAWGRRKLEIAAAYGNTAAFGSTTGLMQEKPFVFFEGTAVIPIHGMLINRFPYSWGYVTGYSFIRAQLAAALEDADVLRIIFDVDTFGGMVAGCVETAEAIFASRKLKPSLAVIDAYCYSAGMYLATAASRVAITPSGGAGSIGVIAMRLDVTKAGDLDGWKVHLIYAGARKVDFQPSAEFTTEARARVQASVDRDYGKFVSSVAKYRGLSEDAIRATEAACYAAEELISLKLVDAILPTGETLLAAELWDENGNQAQQESTEMTTATAAETAEAERQAVALAATERQALAVAAAVGERQRIAAIQGAEEAQSRGTLASYLALNTDMDAVAAVAILKVAAPETKAVAAPAANPLEAAMSNTAQPDVGAGSGGDAPGGPVLSAAQRILAAQTAATGVMLGAKH